jgi:hypothetical protein
MQSFRSPLHCVRTQNGVQFFVVYLHNITTAEPKKISWVKCDKSHLQLKLPQITLTLIHSSILHPLENNKNHSVTEYASCDMKDILTG